MDGDADLILKIWAMSWVTLLCSSYSISTHILYVTGIDASDKLLALAQQRYPEMKWLSGDMREINLTTQFDAIIAFDGFFHLVINDQLKMIERFAN